MRRWLITIALFLLAGAVVNVMVAWTAAVVVNLSLQQTVTLGARTIPAFHQKAKQVSFFEWGLWSRSAPASWVVAIVPEHISATRTASLDQLLPGTECAYLRLCRHLDRPINPGPPTPAWNWLVDHARGWPMPALCCQSEYESQRDCTTFLANGIMVFDGKGTLGRSIMLPLEPIWPGFAVNTVLYAAILWLLSPGLRGYVRRRRGLCPRCAYPKGDSAVCTECGRPLPQRAVA